MRKAIRISNFAQIQRLQSLIRETDISLLLVDKHGSYVDPRSMLGIMSLDFSEPVDFLFDDKNISVIEKFEKTLIHKI